MSFLLSQVMSLSKPFREDRRAMTDACGPLPINSTIQ
jgi:hypothetical protein